MFMLIVAEEWRHRVRRPDPDVTSDPGQVDAPPAVPRTLPAETGPVTAATEMAAADIPRGTRYQLFRALRAMSTGEHMLVEHRIPNLTDHFTSAYKRTEWFRRLRDADSWKDQKDIEAVMVPGTAYPCAIGRILIRCGWCAPSDQPHWVPNLRYFFLTEVGRESFNKAQAWWQELTMLERLRLMLME